MALQNLRIVEVKLSTTGGEALYKLRGDLGQGAGDEPISEPMLKAEFAGLGSSVDFDGNITFIGLDGSIKTAYGLYQPDPSEPMAVSLQSLMPSDIIDTSGITGGSFVALAEADQVAIQDFNVIVDYAYSSPVLAYSASASAPASSEDTVTSGEDNVTGSSSATVTPLDDNSEDGIVGYLQDLSEGDICDAFTNDIAPEQQMLDDMIALINQDNGADEQFATDITEAMENYLEAAHPALVQAIVGMIDMMDKSNEELVEWSVLKAARDLMEARKAGLDTCLDERRDQGLAKVLNRIAAIAAPGTALTYADILALPDQAQHTVTVEMSDGTASGKIQSTVDITSLVKGLKHLAQVRNDADDVFVEDTQTATREWSEAFKSEFLFKYDGQRAANQRDVDYADSVEGGGDGSAGSGGISVGQLVGEERVYVLATDQTDNVSGVATPAYWAADSTTPGEQQDNYQSWSIQAKDASGVDVPSGLYTGDADHENRVKVGDAFPALSSTQGGVAIAALKFGGGFAELVEAIKWKHGMKLDNSGDFIEV